MHSAGKRSEMENTVPYKAEQTSFPLLPLSALSVVYQLLIPYN